MNAGVLLLLFNKGPPLVPYTLNGVEEDEEPKSLLHYKEKYNIK